MTIVRKTQDTATTLTTMADVPDLTFSAAASTNYYFRFVVHCLTATTATGIRFAVNGPASPTAIRYGGIVPISTTVANYGSVATYDAAIFASTSGTSGAVMGIVEGVLQNGANTAACTLRFASEVGGSTATVQANSHGLIIAI